MAEDEGLRSKQRRKGLVIVYTGKGKGKTTAALGLVFRAVGQGLRVCVIQFIKSEKGRWGETATAKRLGIDWHAMGEGFTWQSEDVARDAAKAREAWDFARSTISGSDYDMVVLDEFTYPLKYGWLETAEVIGWLHAHKPLMTHLVITGRDAPEALIRYADLVTEMCSIKHPFDEGIPAQRGIEF